MEVKDRLKARLALTDTSDGLLTELVLSAREIFLSLRYPASPLPADALTDPDFIEPRWDGWLVSAAAELYAKIGAEGQIGHGENGISRSWETADISNALRSRVLPVGRTVPLNGDRNADA